MGQPADAADFVSENASNLDGQGSDLAAGMVAGVLGRLPRGLKMPLRLVLWNGQQIDLGPKPKVSLRLAAAKSMAYLRQPSINHLAEAYVNGHFDLSGDVNDIVEVAMGLAVANESSQGRFARLLKAARHNKTVDKSSIAHHYDVSNAFYQQWLDERMVYSCAYYPLGNEALADAQVAKIDHILKKLMLQKNERLLDIGCGWGALAIRAAQTFGARVVGITLSQNQYELATERVARAGLQQRVDIRLMDYRDLSPRDGMFDKITSIGMFEHVGLKHLGAYFGKMASVLKDGGLVLNHGITSTDPGSGSTPLGAAEFIDKYVFPNGELPHIGLALGEMQAGGIEALDVECLRRHYARTLAQWSHNFEMQSGTLRHLVDEKTWRIWRIYLAGCAYAFLKNWVSLYQVLGCKAGQGASLNPTPWSRAYMYGIGLHPS